MFHVFWVKSFYLYFDEPLLRSVIGLGEDKLQQAIYFAKVKN